MKGRNGQFYGPCPGCGKRCFSLTAGVTRPLYRCHNKQRRCTQEEVRAALEKLKIPCLPTRSHRKAPKDRYRDRVTDLLETEKSAPVFRLKVAVATWECDVRTAAERLGISRSRLYEMLSASPETRTEPQVSEFQKSPSSSPETRTVERSTKVRKTGRHRRSAALERNCLA